MIRERECCGQLCLYLVVFGSEITVIVGGLLFPEQVNVQNVKRSTQILNATVMSFFFFDRSKWPSASNPATQISKAV